MDKKLFFVVLLILFLTCNLTAVVLHKGTEDLNNAVRTNTDPAEKLPVFIVLEEQYDTQALYNEVTGLDKKARREHTIRTLRNFSEKTQADLREVLTEMEKDGLVSELRYLWISNVINFYATQDALLILDKRDDVNRLEYDPFRKVLSDSELYREGADDNSISDVGEDDREIVYNLNVMNVPDVWAQGYMGAGATVAVLDSGINYNHHDITNQMWNHPDYPNHGYNFVHNNHQTMDYHSHGTHCAGTVAGDGTAGSQTGVAPESTIMALLVLDASGSGQQSGVWTAIQFSIDYGADVVSISLGWLHAWNPDRMTWRSVMHNALSAGIIASVAAGNEGNQQYSYPVPSNVRTPGDCPPPWLHPDQTLIGGVSAVMSIGATNSIDQIANFSSRGPVTWQNVTFYNDYAYSPGMGLIRPDVVAPGVTVKSLRHNNNTGYVTMSGTSMAAPNNAGVIALMISKDPTILPEEISQIIEESAHSLSTTKSNTYGSGRVDALAAINMVTADNPPNPATNPTPSNAVGNVSLYPTLSWSNGGGAMMYYVSLGTDDPPTNVVQDYLTEEQTYEVLEELDHSTTYYWRIDSINDNGITQGPVWSFTTSLPVSEDFETGDFTNYDWQFSTVGNQVEYWYVTTEEAFNGNYSARSGEIGDSCITTLYITLEVVEPGTISFYRKISTEDNYDFLRFFINTSAVDQWSGELDWGRESYDIEPGTYTFRWLYTKGPANSGGQDAVWIDDITFPPLAQPMIIPDNLEYDFGLEDILLSWDLEQEPDNDEPLLLGFNIYQALGQETSYTMLNTEPVQDTEYYVPITDEGEQHYYVTALYDIGESEPSESIELFIQPSLEEPVIDPPGGEYDGVISVSITTEEEDAFIYYTTDDIEPDTESLLYTEPIVIVAPLTLKVRLYKTGHLPGDIITHEYSFTTSAEDDLLDLATDLRVYPNPFLINDPNVRNNQSLTLDFVVPREAEEVRIDIYNIKGQLIRSFRQHSGQKHSLQWNLKNQSGGQIGSGIYLIRMRAADEIVNRRVMIIK